MRVVTVEQALTFGGLEQGRILAGKRGIDKVIETVSVLEVAEPDPKAWYLKNQLYITAFYAIAGDKDAQVSVIRSLHANGCVGIVLCHIDYWVKKVHPDVLEVCDELGFPLIVVPSEVTYVEILVPLLNRILEISNERNARSLEIQEELLDLVIREEGLDAICEHVGRLMDSMILVLDVTGRVIGRHGGSEEEVVLLKDRIRQSEIDQPGEDTVIRFVAEVGKYNIYPINHGKMRFGHVVSQSRSTDAEYALLMLKHAALACSLTITQKERKARMRQLYCREFVRDLVSGAYRRSEDAIKAACGMGWEIQSFRHLMVIEIEWPDVGVIEKQAFQERQLQLLDKLVSSDMPGSRVTLLEERLLIFIHEDVANGSGSHRLMERWLSLSGDIPPGRARAGLSRAISDISAFASAYRETLGAISFGKAYLPEDLVCDSTRLGFLPFVREFASGPQFREIQEQLLASLEEYDRKHNHELLRTLEYLLLYEENINMVAEKLFIHRNTVRYRKRKIVSLLGEDPFTGFSRMNYLLAILAHHEDP